jgi:stage II sporulation protein D
MLDAKPIIYKVPLPLHVECNAEVLITNDSALVTKRVRLSSCIVSNDAQGIFLGHKYIALKTVRFFALEQCKQSMKVNGQPVDSIIVRAGFPYADVYTYVDAQNKHMYSGIVDPDHVVQSLKEGSCADIQTIQAVPEKECSGHINNERTFTVRILLAQQTPNALFTLFADKGFIIYSPEKNHKIVHESAELTVVGKNNALSVQDAEYTDRLYIIPKYGYATFNNDTYQGSFIICSDGKRFLLINCLDLEDYVYAVLRTESWPGWPLEINKVFAIACRSYAIATIMEAQRIQRPYHLMNTNAHQTYKGMHSSPIIKEAVEQTRNLFLAHKKRPILAMFDACCGGIIPAHIANFDFVHAPYLARTYPCTYCKKSKLYAWQTVCDSIDLAQRFDIKRLRDIKITKKDKAGLVQEVLFKGHRQNIKIPGKKLYGRIPGIKSFCFTAHKKAGKIIFKGRGYGHHLGLCQWGAREMVRDGWDYRRILAFYYPGTQCMKLV